MRTGSNAYKERGASIVFLLTQKPRSLHELHELTGCSLETVRGWLQALEAEGLLARQRQRKQEQGPPAFIYEWQTTNHTDES
jgi:predicted ArsR family transcriptional regulator